MAYGCADALVDYEDADGEAGWEVEGGRETVEL